MTREEMENELRKCERRYWYFDGLLFKAAHEPRRLTTQERAICIVCGNIWNAVLYWREQLGLTDWKDKKHSL